MNWNKNEDVKFQYFCRGQSAALLTWVLMKDRKCHYILEEEKDEIPLYIQVENSTIFQLKAALTTQMQKDFASENARENNNEESSSGNRRKRLKAALERIQDGVMDSLGC